MSSLFVPEGQRVSLTVRDLRVILNTSQESQKKTPWWRKKPAAQDREQDLTNSKVILNDINLDLEPGKVLAILGSSGSGKTTLLNTLSSRMSLSRSRDNPFKFSGMVRYSQKSPNVSYLLQEDVFMPGLTVRETLEFTAHLRLPQASAAERHELIDYLLTSLGIKKISSTMICDFYFRTTLSGGERRRVSLAIQLLTRPSVLFLDEPTTGLDAHTSISLVQTVKHLAEEFGITIILTIHQPRFEILEIVDKLFLLAKGGNPMFCGSLREGEEYFDQIGIQKEESNFADFLLTISSVEKTMSREVELQTQERVGFLIKQWRSHEELHEVEFKDSFERGSALFDKSHPTLPLWKESWLIAKRTALMTVRDYQSLIMMFGTVLVLSIICGWVFYKPGGSLAGIRSVTSALYVCCEVLGFTPMMYEIERLCSVDGKFLIREKKEGMYTISGWFIGRRLAKMAMEDIPSSIVWSVITYYMWGLNGSSDFGIYFINNLFLYMIGIALAHSAYVFGGYHFSTASLVSGIFYQIQNSACGYFISAKTMPVYVRWTKYIASFWYNFGSLVSNEFTGYMGDCVGSTEECYEYSGQAVLDNLGYPRHWYAVPLGVSVAWYLGFYVASAILFWYKERQGTVKIVKERYPSSFKPLVEKSRPKLSEVPGPQNAPPVTLSLHGTTLTLKPSLLKNKILRRPFTPKQLLSDVSVSFAPGLNAIMGPSGSGKTTLLNFLTGRTSKSTISINSTLEINGHEIPIEDLRRITSYVVQEDSVLIPTLTVRETLEYQARLRLDKAEHASIPQILDLIMKKMGLMDVANVPIGDASVKGISGGEKRRVSIAVQLLNDSKVLLLDEPTSGLDSFTSNQIVSLLDELAKTEDKTIIMTIHQPKYEIFEKFDKVLLLGDGHVLFEGGPTALVEYFDQLGFQPDYDANFADFVLDTIASGGDESMIPRLVGSWIQVSPDTQAPHSVSEKMDFTQLHKRQQPFSVVFRPVVERQAKVLMRSPDVLYSRIIQLIALSIIHALYFAPLKHTSESINNRLGLIQEVMNLYFVGLFNNMAFYPGEKNMFYQEYQDLVYSPGVFMLSYLCTEVPFEVVSTFILSIFTVLVIGLPRNAQMFFTMFYVSFLTLNTGESVGVTFNTVFDHLGIAVNLLGNFVVVAIFMGGTMSLHMPILFRVFNYISPLKWAVLVLAQLGFRDQTFECGGGSETSCALDTGDKVLAQYGLRSDYASDMGVLALIAVVYRVISWLVVEWKVRYAR